MNIGLVGCAFNPDKKPQAIMSSSGDIDKWGIRVESIRLTGSNHFVDFRFRVIDPKRAGSLLERKDKAYLLHEPTGKAFGVPVTKVGPLRSSAVDPKIGRAYVILFSNTNKIIQNNDPVTVVIGEFKISGIRIGTARGQTNDLDADSREKLLDIQRNLLRSFNECITKCDHDQKCKKECRDIYETELGKAYVEMVEQ